MHQGEKNHEAEEMLLDCALVGTLQTGESCQVASHARWPAIPAPRHPLDQCDKRNTPLSVFPHITVPGSRVIPAQGFPPSVKEQSMNVQRPPDRPTDSTKH